jgi:cholesterol transport system auxiliary component
MTPRYFSPETGATATRHATVHAGGPEAQRLRLGNVSGASQLRERMVFRDSAYELAYYPDRRWTERPEAYLRRALARSLFEEHGLARVGSGYAPTLDAELVAFEEVRSPERRARVQVIMTLDDDRAGSEEVTISVERPIRAASAGDDAAAVVEALSLALEACVAQIAARVVHSVAEHDE